MGLHKAQKVQSAAPGTARSSRKKHGTDLREYLTLAVRPSSASRSSLSDTRPTSYCFPSERKPAMTMTVGCLPQTPDPPPDAFARMSSARCSRYESTFRFPPLPSEEQAGTYVISFIFQSQ